MVRSSPEIESVMHRVVSAWNSRDLDVFDNLYLSDDRFRGIGTALDEFWVGKEFLAVREAQFDEMPHFEMTLDRIHAFENGSTGWVASTGILSTPTGEHPLRVIAVFLLEAGVWRIVLWNTSIARSNLELFDIELTTTLNELLDSVSEDAAAIASIGSKGEIVSLLFTDVVDSTVLAAQIGDAEWAALMARYDKGIRDVTERNHGRVVKTLGDGSMLAFSSARDAVAASIDIQRELGGDDIALRVGIHSGHALRTEDDLLGLTVNKAARITAAAEGGSILSSSTVKDLVGSMAGVEFGPAKNLTLKGLDGLHQVFEVIWRDSAATLANPPANEDASSR